MFKGGTHPIFRLYFAVVSAVTLFTMMFATIGLLDTALRTYIIRTADTPSYIEDCHAFRPTPIVDGPGGATEPISEEELQKRIEEAQQQNEDQRRAECEERRDHAIKNYERQKANKTVNQLAMLIVSAPLFAIHFMVLLKEWRKQDKK